MNNILGYLCNPDVAPFVFITVVGVALIDITNGAYKQFLTTGRKTTMKTNLDTDYKVDEEKAKKGVWVDDLGGVGVDFRLRRTNNNDDYAEYSRKLLRPHRKKLASGKIPTKVMNNITNKVLAKTIITGWRGIFDYTNKENPVEFPFSIKNAIELLETYPDLADDITAAAGDIGNFLEETEMDEGNSESASNGT